jgi:hypothetical protein
MLSSKFKKFITVLVLVLFINFTFTSISYSYSYTITNPILSNIMRYMPFTPGGVIGVGLGLASGFAYLYYKDLQATYNLTNVNDLTGIVSSFEYGGYTYNYSATAGGGSASCGSSGYYVWGKVQFPINCSITTPQNFSSGDTVYVAIVTKPGSTINYTVYSYKKSSIAPIDTSKPITSAMPYSKIQDIPDENSTILPITLDLTKTITENVDSIKSTLKNAGYSSDVINSVDYNSVTDLLTDIPYSLRQSMPLSTYEQALLDTIAERKASDSADEIVQSSTTALTLPLNDTQDAVQVEIKDVPDVPAIPDTIFPAVPEFDTTLDLPAQKDFLLPIKNFFQNVFNSIPFISMINNANIEISNPQSVVNFSYKNQNFSFDFNDYIDTFNFMSTVIIFCASVLFVFILIL